MEEISVGCHVVVKKLDGGHMRVVPVAMGQIVLIEKLKLYLDGAVGAAFGSFFDVRKQQLFLSENFQTSEAAEEPDEAENGSLDASVAADESDSTEKQSGQKISYESLLGMRKSGVSSKRIVSKLVEGSVSYAQKTTQAQDKYVRRKKRKHSDRVLVLKPKLRLLADIFFKKDTEKCASLRMDFLAQILGQANVCHGATVALMEQCQGLVTAGVLERLSGAGRCIHLHKGVQAQAIPAVDSMDFSPEVMETFYPIPLSQLFECEESGDIHKMRYFGDPHEVLPISEDQGQQEKLAERRTKQEQRRNRLQAALTILREKQLDSVILALRWTHPLSVLKELIHSVRPSGCLVLFSPFIQPLVDCYLYLKDNDLAVNLRLTDSFFRHHQILPSRTHPEMNQYVAGGFLLSATVVLP